MKWILEPWPWYLAGPMIALVLYTLLYWGRKFGFSSNLKHLCAAAGAGKKVSFFDYKLKEHRWSLLFMIGTVLGAFIASQFLMTDHTVDLNPSTIAALEKLDIDATVDSYVPNELFDPKNLSSPKVLLILLGGGLLIGFGTRWANGCTSGHSISGLSNLQLPSLIATIGFFIGGLVMTHFLLPIIL